MAKLDGKFMGNDVTKRFAVVRKLQFFYHDLKSPIFYVVKSGTCQMAGFGREGFAYPQFIHDLKEKGAMDPQKCCISCGKCSELMRMGTVAGCVIRNPKYPPIYQTAREAMQKKA